MPRDALPPSFGRLAWSNLAAQSAEQIGLAATPIIAVISLGADAGMAGLLHVAQTLPFVLLSIPIGLVVDRTSRPRLMAAAEMLRAASLLAIMTLAAAGQLGLASLAILGFVGACGTVGYSVAAPALVPALVRAQQLPLANGRIELARTVAFAAGPALGGALVGWAGATSAFGVAVALSLAAVCLLAGVRDERRPSLAPRRPMLDILDGARFVFGHSLLRPIFAIQVVFNVAFFVLQAVYVPYAVRHLGLSPTGIGLTLAAYGAGMIGGALVSASLVRSLRFGMLIGIGPVVGLAGSVAVAATIVWPNPYIVGVGWLLLGAGPIQWTISTTTLRQLVTPPELLGRVSAVNITSYGARPIGAAIGALVGSWSGAEAALLVAVALFATQAWLAVSSPVVRLVQRPLAAA